ncbi:MAG: hypothetical protein R8K47_05985 [Mariprofundaceae bacterium]
MRRIAMLLLAAVLMAGCSAKSDRQVQIDLWRGWAEIDALMQREWPGAPPLVLVHGWNGSEFTWPDAARLQRWELRLHRDVFYFTYRTGALPDRYPPLEALEEILERFLAGFPEGVDIVAHSMGGLLVRQYLAHHPDGHRIRRVLFLSVPHFGADAARYLAGFASISAEGNAQAQEIEPGSDFLWRLDAMEGQELEGVTVLNAFTTGDRVVGPSSRWLPWAPNVAVEGDHHTLPRSIDRLPFVEAFLQQGALPRRLAEEPRTRDVWLRMRDERGWVRFSEVSVARLDESGRPVEKGVSLCCERRSSLDDEGATTVILRDVWRGQGVRLIDRSHREAKFVFVPVPRPLHDPVTLVIVDREGRVIERTGMADAAAGQDQEAVPGSSASGMP